MIVFPRPTTRSGIRPQLQVRSDLATMPRAFSCPPQSSYPLADLFLDQPGRAPGHDGDDDSESEDILVRAGEGQQHGADRLQPGEKKAAEDRPVDATKPADDRGGKADHAEIKTDAKVNFIVIKPVHHAGEGGKTRTDRESDEYDRSEIDAH